MTDSVIREAPVKSPIAGNLSATLAWLEWFDRIVTDLNTSFELLGLRVERVDGTEGNLTKIVSGGNLDDSGISADFPAQNFAVADAVSDAVAVTLVEATVGANQINLTNLNTALATLKTEIDAIVTNQNAILAALRAAGIMAES